MSDKKDVTVKIIDKNKLDVKMTVPIYGVSCGCSQCGSQYELRGKNITCIECGNVDFVYGDYND